MKKIFLAISFLFQLTIQGICQTNKELENVDFKFKKPVMVFYNDKKIDVEKYSDSNLSIGIVIHDYINREDERKSMLEHYIDYNKDEQDKIPVFFIFSEDRLASIDVEEFRFLIQKDPTKCAFIINDSPFSQNINELNKLSLKTIDKIQMVKDFKLIKWDTGEEDVFTLFVIKTKRI